MFIVKCANKTTHKKVLFLNVLDSLKKGNRNCFNITFLTTFLIQLFERFCCLYMPLHFTVHDFQGSNDSMYCIDRSDNSDCLPIVCEVTNML